MRRAAHRYGRGAEDEPSWAIAGLIHDADYERWPDDHPGRVVAWLRERGEGEIADAVAAHYTRWGHPYPTAMSKALLACDELTGFVVACALVRPEGIATLEPSSVKKKLKDRGFAAKVDRDEVRAGVALLGADLDAHIRMIKSTPSGRSPAGSGSPARLGRPDRDQAVEWIVPGSCSWPSGRPRRPGTRSAIGAACRASRCRPPRWALATADRGTWMGGDASFLCPLDEARSFWSFADAGIAPVGTRSRLDPARKVIGLGHTIAIATCKNGKFSVMHYYRGTPEHPLPIFIDPNNPHNDGKGSRFWLRKPSCTAATLHLRPPDDGPGDGLQHLPDPGRQPAGVAPAWTYDYLALGVLPAPKLGEEPPKPPPFTFGNEAFVDERTAISTFTARSSTTPRRSTILQVPGRRPEDPAGPAGGGPGLGRPDPRRRIHDEPVRRVEARPLRPRRLPPRRDPLDPRLHRAVQRHPEGLAGRLRPRPGHRRASRERPEVRRPAGQQRLPDDRQDRIRPLGTAGPGRPDPRDARRRRPAPRPPPRARQLRLLRRRAPGLRDLGRRHRLRLHHRLAGRHPRPEPEPQAQRPPDLHQLRLARRPPALRPEGAGRPGR